MTDSIKPFVLSDIDDFNCRDLTWDTVYSESLLAIPMVTYRVKGDIVAIYGLRMIHDGVAEGFLYGDHRIKEHKIKFHLLTKKLVHFAMNKYNLHRLEIIVEKSNLKWGLSLGFDLEATMRKWNKDKSDAYLLSKVGE